MYRFVRACVVFGIASFGLLAQQAVMRQYTVSTLPVASSNNGVSAQVRDGANAYDCSTGGGILVVNCVSNGTTWQAESVGAAASSTMIVANASTTGTTANKLAKLTGAPSTAVIAGTGDTTGILGVVIAGAGTSGSATVQTYGFVQAAVDGATIAGDYLVASTTTGGALHDSGATYPNTAVQVIGRITSTNASAGTYSVYLFPTEVRGYPASSVVKLTGSASITPSAIVDGGVAAQGTTITISGAAVGDPVSVGANAALATGLIPSGAVTSANTVTVYIQNLSGATVTPPAGTYTATIVH